MAKRFTAQLFVSRLSAYTTDQSLRKQCSPFGQITEARLIIDQQTQRPKGFGVITFESEDDAQKALKALNGKIFNGRLIFVEAGKEVEATRIYLKSNKSLKRNKRTHTQDTVITKQLKNLKQNHSRVLHCYNSKERIYALMR